MVFVPEDSTIARHEVRRLGFGLAWPLGTGHDWRYTLDFQPVVPLKLNNSWTLIVRTIVPFIRQEDLFKGALDQVTLPDDIVQKLKGTFGRT